MSIPAKILTPDQQEDYLEIVEMTLNNLNFAKLIAQVVYEYQREGLPWPEATVHFKGKYPFDMGSGNLFVIALPVLQIAILDCRRAVEFFGLKFCGNPPVLTSLAGGAWRRRGDDIGIEHFGLPLVNPDEFLKVSNLDKPTLHEVYEAANKQLAHFTNDELKFDPQQTEQVARGIIDAFHVLLYDRLPRQRPDMQLKVVPA
jgi:hypothetical protein